MLYLTILSAGFLLALANVLGALRRHGTAGIALDPVIWFSIFFTIIHILTPAVKFDLGKYRYQYDYDDWTLIFTSLALICAYQLTVIFLRNVSRHQTPRTPRGRRFPACVRRWTGPTSSCSWASQRVLDGDSLAAATHAIAGIAETCG